MARLLAERGCCYYTAAGAGACCYTINNNGGLLTSSDREAVRRVKEQLSYVALDFDQVGSHVL